MTEDRFEGERNSGNDALASLPEAAQPQAKRPVDVADPLSDPTVILQGAQIFGKASWSTGRMGVIEGPIAQYVKAKTAQDAREAEEARQLERLEAWGRATTTVGGVAMTNGEAQEARQRVIENDEAYANWAVKTGRIREDEKDDFKAAIRRKKELEDKRGRGTLTEAEAAEADRLNRSRAGEAAEAATADSHLRRARTLDAGMQRNDANAELKQAAPVPTSGDQSPFQALQAAQPPVNPEPVAISRKAAATGLNL